MTAITTAIQSARVGLVELPTTYTLRSWLGGWVVRLFFQVVFFTLLARLAGSPAQGDYVLLGNAVAVVTLDAMFVSITASMERFQGTFPLLVSSPTRMGLVYLGRGIHWPMIGLVNGTIVFLAVSVVFDVPWPLWLVVVALPIMALIALSSYFYACVLAAFALRNVKLRSVFPEVGFLVLLAFCGVNVPYEFWPAPIEAVAQVLPLTHGLAAIRSVTSGGTLGATFIQVGLELAVAVLWMTLSFVALERIAARGTRDGSLSFTS